MTSSHYNNSIYQLNKSMWPQSLLKPSELETAEQRQQAVMGRTHVIIPQ